MTQINTHDIQDDYFGGRHPSLHYSTAARLDIFFPVVLKKLETHVVEIFLPNSK